MGSVGSASQEESEEHDKEEHHKEEHHHKEKGKEKEKHEGSIRVEVHKKKDGHHHEGHHHEEHHCEPRHHEGHHHEGHHHEKHHHEKHHHEGHHCEPRHHEGHHHEKHHHEKHHHDHHDHHDHLKHHGCGSHEGHQHHLHHHLFPWIRDGHVITIGSASCGGHGGYLKVANHDGDLAVSPMVTRQCQWKVLVVNREERLIRLRSRYNHRYLKLSAVTTSRFVFSHDTHYEIKANGSDEDHGEVTFKVVPDHKGHGGSFLLQSHAHKGKYIGTEKGEPAVKSHDHEHHEHHGSHHSHEGSHHHQNEHHQGDHHEDRHFSVKTITIPIPKFHIRREHDVCEPHREHHEHHEHHDHHDNKHHHEHEHHHEHGHHGHCGSHNHVVIASTPTDGTHWVVKKVSMM